MRLLTSTINTVAASNNFPLYPGERLSITLEVAGGQTFKGHIRVEFSEDGGKTWHLARTPLGTQLAFDSDEQTGVVVATTIRHEGTAIRLYRVRVDRLGDPAGDPCGYTLWCKTITLQAAGEAARLLPGSFDQVATNGSVASALDLTIYETKVTTGGSQGSEAVTLGNGAGVTVGTRKLVTCETLTHASDKVALDHANMVNAAGAALTAATIDAAGGSILVSWNGTKWQVVHSKNATLST